MLSFLDTASWRDKQAEWEERAGRRGSPRPQSPDPQTMAGVSEAESLPGADLSH